MCTHPSERLNCVIFFTSGDRSCPGSFAAFYDTTNITEQEGHASQSSVSLKKEGENGRLSSSGEGPEPISTEICILR